MAYVSIALKEHHYLRAEEAVSKMPIYKGSYRGEQANYIGVLGEIVFMEYLDEQGVAYTDDFTTTHDITIVGSGRLDIKTKDRTVIPKLSYDASIPMYNHEHQNVAYWGFVSLQRNRDYPAERFARGYGHAHLIGVANRHIVENNGKIWKAGETDTSNGTKFWTDCLNLPISVLKPTADATAIWKSRQTN